MHLHVIATGRTRDAALLKLESEYVKRLTHPWAYSVRELKDDAHAAAAQLAALKGLPPGTAVIGLDERGQGLTSTQWAEKFGAWQGGGTRRLAFLIGGADGLTQPVRQACPQLWSLSPLTLPHQLVRVLLAEQCYRATTLLGGHPYHRP